MRRWLVLFVAAAIVSTPRPGRAHQDPPACFSTGVSISIGMFRSDGVTGVVGTIQDCEQVFYRATLAKTPTPGACAFSGGQFTFTAPDGTVTTLLASVPCLGGTSGEGCVSGVDSFQSGLVPYHASPADVSGGFVTAAADYANGVSHDSPGNTAGVFAHTPKATPVVACSTPTTSTSTTSPPTTTSTTTAGATTTSTTQPPSVCSATKLTTATKLALALTKCDAKGVKGGVAAVQACRDKAIAKFTTKWGSLETKPDCFTTGDVTDIQDLIDACTTSLLHELVPYTNP
jgi:hypothetical protein